MDEMIPAGLDGIVAARRSRVAKGRQTTIESQDMDARDWARDAGINVVQTVPDTASGTKAMWERKNLRPWVTDPELMARYQVIIAAKQDRLSRADWRDEDDLRRWAEDHGKILYVIDRNLRWPPREGPQYEDDVERWNRGAEDAYREWATTSRRYKRMQRGRIADNCLVGRATYGYERVPAEDGDGMTLVIYEPHARIVREAVDRYLAGESTAKIRDDFNARGIPSPMEKSWHQVTLSNLLRNPALAGRRMDGWGKDERERKTILRFPGIITWAEHEQLCARLDSRAYRKGISPGNVAMLTSIISDKAGHPMYRINRPPLYYYCRKGCVVSVPLEYADEQITQAVLSDYGDYDHMIRRTIPGKNYFEDMEQLRRDRAELDDLAPDYDERHVEITAEIRRLSKLQPEPNAVARVKSGKTVAEHWRSLTVAQRRDWLLENEWKVTAYRDALGSPPWGFAIDAGLTGKGGGTSQAASLDAYIPELER